MKSTLTYFVLSVTLLAAASQGEETGKVDDYDLVPIGSLDEVQGRWTSEPAGALRFRGTILDIDSAKGTYSGLTDTPPKRHDPVEVGIEIERGALLLKTDSEHVKARKWHLAKLGKQKCLVAMVRIRGSAPPHLTTAVLYLKPPKDEGK